MDRNLISSEATRSRTTFEQPNSGLISKAISCIVALLIGGCTNLALSEAPIGQLDHVPRSAELSANKIVRWNPSLFVTTIGGPLNRYNLDGKLLESYPNFDRPTGLSSDAATNLLVGLAGLDSNFDGIGLLSPTGGVNTIAVDGLPWSEVVCPNGKLYISNLGLHPSMLIYDETTGTQLGSFDDKTVQVAGALGCDRSSNVYEDFYDTTGTPQFVEYVGGTLPQKSLQISLTNADGFRFLRNGDFALANGGAVEFFKVGQSAPYKSIGGFQDATALAFDKKERELWVVDSDANEIDRVDAVTGTITPVLGGFTRSSPPIDVFVFPTNQFSKPDQE